jgi:hypothetical protein
MCHVTLACSCMPLAVAHAKMARIFGAGMCHLSWHTPPWQALYTPFLRHMPRWRVVHTPFLWPTPKWRVDLRGVGTSCTVHAHRTCHAPKENGGAHAKMACSLRAFFIAHAKMACSFLLCAPNGMCHTSLAGSFEGCMPRGRRNGTVSWCRPLGMWTICQNGVCHANGMGHAKS